MARPVDRGKDVLREALTRNWSTAWSGAREVLSRRRGGRHVWVSGIAHYNGGAARRGTLRAVVEATRCCDEDVVDVCVKPRG